MIQRQRRDAALNTLKMIPTRWAIAIVAILIGYVLLQPRANQWFGWDLPSIPAMLGEEKPKSKEMAKAKTKEDLEKSSTAGRKEASEREPTPSKVTTDRGKSKTQSTKLDSKSTDKPTHQVSDSDKTHGILSEIGRNRFESPAGLIYGPGSEEGHRLKHIERHLADQPNRFGSHGVFEGDMEDFLAAIDDGYDRAKKGAKGTNKRTEDDSTVYEASFDKIIGFMGGKEGARRKNPPLKKIRIVVRGNSLITAFPF